MNDTPTPPPPALRFTIEDGIAVVTLDRPDKLNSLNPELVCRLADAWDTIAGDPAVRVAIVTGAGDRAFCTGADLGRLIPLFTRARPPDDEWDERLLADHTLLDRALLRRTDFTIPVIAAIRGFALAGGTELMLGTDLRIAAEDSEFGLTGSVAASSTAAAGSLGSPARCHGRGQPRSCSSVTGSTPELRSTSGWSTASSPPTTSWTSRCSSPAAWPATARSRCERPRR